MNSCEYSAVAYEHEIYCIDCLPDGIENPNRVIDPIFANTEWDVYPICCICGREHDYVVLLEEQK